MCIYVYYSTPKPVRINKRGTGVFVKCPDEDRLQLGGIMNFPKTAVIATGFGEVSKSLRSNRHRRHDWI